MNKIPLWRNRPPSEYLSSKNNFDLEYIFPSGRQALTFSLQKAGLTRADRVAIPEWSSHCVISAVGKVATPIPMNEVLKYNIKVDAVLLYEQWGWPIPRIIKSHLVEKFRNATIIIDRVDSADIDNKNRIKFYPKVNQIDIISLSKILGLYNGGLSKLNGKYLKFKEDSNDKDLCAHIWNKESINIFSEKLHHIHKNDIKSLHPDLYNWLSNNNLIEALKNECSIRRENLSIIISNSLSLNWPNWMINVFNKGAGPGIAPLFRGLNRTSLLYYKDFLEKTYKLETRIYHFDYSGDPLNPEYNICLAFPIHGLVKNNLSKIMDSLTYLMNF